MARVEFEQQQDYIVTMRPRSVAIRPLTVRAASASQARNFFEARGWRVRKVEPIWVRRLRTAWFVGLGLLIGAANLAVHAGWF